MNIALNRLDPNLPDPVESRRRAAGRLVRIAYTTIVFGVLAFIVIYFGRPFVYLSGPGVVASPLVVVSLPYTVQVRQMKVARGARVEAGQEIGKVWSPQQDDIVATYMRALGGGQRPQRRAPDQGQGGSRIAGSRPLIPAASRRRRRTISTRRRPQA